MTQLSLLGFYKAQLCSFELSLEFESRVDAVLSRKKVDIQEALKNPPCIQKTLRIYVFNTFANQIMLD